MSLEFLQTYSCICILELLDKASSSAWVVWIGGEGRDGIDKILYEKNKQYTFYIIDI